VTHVHNDFNFNFFYSNVLEICSQFKFATLQLYMFIAFYGTYLDSRE